MTEDRFRKLAEAYGGDIARWPHVERAEAEVFARARPDAAEVALAAELALDAALEAYQVEASATLRQRIVAAAPRSRGLAPTWRWVTAAGLGLGLAASGAAGLAAGFTLAAPGITGFIAAPAGDSNAADEPSALADPAGDAADS